jgi:hypothetical protein
VPKKHGVEMARLMVGKATLQEAGAISQNDPTGRALDVEVASFSIIPDDRSRDRNMHRNRRRVDSIARDAEATSAAFVSLLRRLRV